MFSRIAPSSPVLEINTNLNGFPDYLPENAESMDQKMNDNNFNLMLNQIYTSQLYTSTSSNNNYQFVHPANYQYVLNHQQQAQASLPLPPPQPQAHTALDTIFDETHFLQTSPPNALDTMSSVFDDTSLLQTSPSLDDMPPTSTTASTLSDLESLNLQFIHPQDVVSFPSIHACTPPMEQTHSRRSSFFDAPNMSQQKSFMVHDLTLQQQQQQQQSQMISQSMQYSQSDHFLSSVETTPILSDLPHIHNSLEEVAHQKLIPPTATTFHNFVKSESIEPINFNDDDSDTYQTFPAEREQEDFHDDEEEDHEFPEITEIKKFRVVRGISSGGCATRPPKEAKNSTSTYAKVKLHLSSAGLDDMCKPAWNNLEKADRRRIIRIERRQNYADIVASFSIVGSATDHPEPVEAEEGVDVVEVSCLETVVDDNYDDYENASYDFNEDDTLLEDDIIKQEQGNHNHQNMYPAHSQNGNVSSSKTQYYITSVEVIKIVELLIGTQPLDGANRRRERGRVRSNLVPFWSRKPVSSKKNHSASSSPIESKDFRIELAQRIMGYEVRKPRGFDKEVRILKWEKLIPALRRALQSYYVEIPETEF